MQGLYPKYHIEHTDGTPVTDFKFVLSPKKDIAAKKAILTYCRLLASSEDIERVMKENAGTYLVTKSDGSPIKSSKFVLSPEQGLASLLALHTYAEYTPNEELRSDLTKWIQTLMQAIH